MISQKVLKTLEYDKILALAGEYAVLSSSKKKILSIVPETSFEDALNALRTTEEADKLLYKYAVSGVDFFDEISDELDRSEKGAALSCAELLRVMRLLKSSRITAKAIISVDDDQIVLIKRIAENLYYDPYLENEIKEKIVSDDSIADSASEALYQIRRKIKRINEQIREKLSSYLRGEKVKYLQENIITMRDDRYVVPVKSEYKGNVRGLVHDQSSTGATVFIEPEAVLELNNDLKTAMLEERAEMDRILSDLSHSVGLIAEKLTFDIDLLSEVDIAFAKAEYAYKTKSVVPHLNHSGKINIKQGRHPLIDKEKVVPLNISLGDKYRFLLITGPNTGGKTVSLKLVGLFTLMAMSGFFVPAACDSELSFFDEIFSDIGDEQSIEQNLSTFSSHIKNIINIMKNVGNDSLVLIDEIGAGTDPDEGGALAQAILECLLSTGCRGIVTTHYSRLKEFAFTRSDIVNASMDFDSKTFEPLYKMLIGTPGSSNAIEISVQLGLDRSIAENAYGLLSDNKISFENVLREAERSRREAEQLKAEYYSEKKEVDEILEGLRRDRIKFDSERNRFLAGAKAEARRIVNEKSEIADELIDEIKEILKKEELDGGDLIKARTLKNKIDAEKYEADETEDETPGGAVSIDNLKVGDSVFVRSVGSVGTVTKISSKRKEVEVVVGSVRLNVGEGALSSVGQKNVTSKKRTNINVARSSSASGAVSTELNVIGQTTDEAIINVEKFLDSCLLNNVTECRIVHGKGMNILSKAIQAYLKKDPRVAEYRFGRYGEGENGVTIVTLK